MKKIQLFKKVTILVLCCAMLGCGKNDVEPKPEPEIVTRIYGVVFNSQTGETVQRAEIVFGKYDSWESHDKWKRISTSVSGSDGQYEIVFGELPNLSSHDFYYLEVTCSGYQTQNNPISIVEGNSHRLDVNLVPE